MQVWWSVKSASSLEFLFDCPKMEKPKTV